MSRHSCITEEELVRLRAQAIAVSAGADSPGPEHWHQARREIRRETRMLPRDREGRLVGHRAPAREA